MQEHLDSIREVFSKPVDPNDPEIRSFKERLDIFIESRRIDPNASPEEHYQGLVRNLKGSMESGSVTSFDSDAAELFYFSQEHPELFATDQELEEHLDALNAFVGAAWKAPGWERGLERILRPKLETPNSEL